MSRDEHLEQSKRRALSSVGRVLPIDAVTGLLSDLSKHEETKNHPGIDIGFQLMLIGQLSTDAEARRFIEGFH